jgi:hypothetical protein
MASDGMHRNDGRFLDLSRPVVVELITGHLDKHNIDAFNFWALGPLNSISSHSCCNQLRIAGGMAGQELER